MSTTFANSIDNNPIYADRAEHDAAGNDIQTTYATKAELPEFSQAQQDAMDSGINSTKVGNYDSHLADTTIHVTSADKTAWNAKEDASNKKQSIDSTSTTDYPSSKATADFVNSSVATATANFLGNYTLTDLGLTYPATDAQIETALNGYTFSQNPTNNDYVYVEIQNPQTTGIDDSVERFKFNGTQWLYEYTLNNSSFTAAEKAAIDSGITSSDVTAYNAHIADTDIHVTTSDKSTWNGKQDAINDLSTIRSGASAGATAVQPGDLATVATTGDYADLLNKPTIPTVPVQDVEVDGTSVVNANGVAEITLPTFTQSQADWTEADTTDPSYVQNKPTVKPIVAGTNITITEGTNDITIASQASAQVQADYAQSDSSAVDYIKNKPTIKTVVAGSNITITESGSTVTIAAQGSSQSQANWTEADNTDPSYIQNKPTIKPVVAGSNITITEGANNVTIAATVPSSTVTDVEVDGTSVVNASGVAEITMPTIPVTDVEVGGSSVVNAQGIAEITLPTIPVTDVEVGGTSVVNAQGVAEITMPTIPVTDVEVDGTSVLNAQGVAEITMPTFTQAQANWTESDNQSVQYIQNKPTLAAVATSGAYSDLSGTPTINNVPAVTSSDDSKVLKASYSGGVGSYSWESESGGTVTDVEVDGTSVVSGGVASITMPTELVPTVTSSDDGKVLKATYSGGTGSYSWETESGGTVTDVEVDGTSVVSGGVASITMPTELVPTVTSSDDGKILQASYSDNTGSYDWASGVNLVAGTNVTLTESQGSLTISATGGGASYTAGTGISISNQNVISADETVLWEGTLNTLNSDISCSESIYSFGRIKVFYRIVADNAVQSVAVHEFEPAGISSTNFISFGSLYLVNNGWYGWWICRLAITDTTKIKITKTLNSYGNGASPSGYSADTTSVGFIYKVVGINRIASN